MTDEPTTTAGREPGYIIWKTWRDQMLAQGREVAPERMTWETLPARDKALDSAIEAVVVRDANVQVAALVGGMAQIADLVARKSDLTDAEALNVVRTMALGWMIPGDLSAAATQRDAELRRAAVEAKWDAWPPGVSDGLVRACSDCGQVPPFDYCVADGFWDTWVPRSGPDNPGVVCLPCLNRRCGGVGLAEALSEVQWTGTGHTVVLRPERRYEYAALLAPETPK